MIASFAEILKRESEAGRAVGAFTCYDLSTAAGVLCAAEVEHVPVILLMSKASFAHRSGELLASALVAAASAAPAVACVQLDHVSDLALIARAFELGVGAVMADGSQLPLAENARLVSEATRLAAAAGAGVEAELGHIEGGEDVAAATRAGALTGPREAQLFVETCRPDCLAVSIGNVHGAYAETPRLDWSRLEQISEHVPIPLSLHGASGIPSGDIRRSVRLGIRKINVNTELRRRAFDNLERHLAELRDGYRMLELQEVLIDASTSVTAEIIRSLHRSDAAQ